MPATVFLLNSVVGLELVVEVVRRVARQSRLVVRAAGAHLVLLPIGALWLVHLLRLQPPLRPRLPALPTLLGKVFRPRCPEALLRHSRRRSRIALVALGGVGRDDHRGAPRARRGLSENER